MGRTLVSDVFLWDGGGESEPHLPGHPERGPAGGGGGWGGNPSANNIPRTPRVWESRCSAGQSLLAPLVKR